MIGRDSDMTEAEYLDLTMADELDLLDGDDGTGHYVDEDGKRCTLRKSSRRVRGENRRRMRRKRAAETEAEADERRRRNRERMRASRARQQIGGVK